MEDGALPHEVDAALKDFGYAMGIFAVHDMAGNDVGYQTRKAQMATRPTDRRWNDLILKLCDLGRFGQKSGKGWYRYEAGDRSPQRDPEVEQFIVEESARMGIKRRPMTEDEIIKRCLYGMVNEGAKLLEQGIALRPGDIDISTSRATAFRPTMAARCTWPTGSAWTTCWPTSGASTRRMGSGGRPRRCWRSLRAATASLPISDLPP